MNVALKLTTVLWFFFTSWGNLDTDFQLEFEYNQKERIAVQLLPCPFCGKEPEIDKYKVRGVMVWNIGCMNDDCDVHVETDDFESEEEAGTAWNTRGYPDG